MFVPALLIWFSIEVRAPVPIATMTMTAATPMIMPSAVSAVRIALRRRARTAMASVFHKRHGSFVLRRSARRPPACASKAASSPSARRRAVTGVSLRTRPSRNATIRVRVLGDVGLVRDQHDRQPLRVQPLEDAHHLDARAGVEVAGRLVGQQQHRRFTSARAIATRCCWPPDSWFG